METSTEQKNRGNYKIEVWTIADLLSAVSEKPNKGKKVIIPKYQRGLVWAAKQKAEFIKSVKQGFPFGALLLAQEKEGEYTLLDGLQRTSTIREHIKNPNKWFDGSTLTDQNLSWLLNLMKIRAESQNVEMIRNLITTWIQSKTGFEETVGWSAFDLTSEIISNFKANVSDIKSIVDPLKPILKKAKEEADISNTDIPMILYFGPRDSLPTIFENLNSKGTKLNKYQIFAATWQDQLEIRDQEIIDLIQQKYQALLEEGFQVENYDEDNFSKGPFTYFEYVFGFGKLLCTQYQILFGLSDNDTAESIGFNLIASCLGLHISDMAKLPNTLKTVVESGKLEKFQQAILESTKFVYLCLKPFITLRANRKKKNNNPKVRIYHTEYQIVSFIAKVFKNRYSENFEETKSWKTAKSIYEKTLPQHYFFDIIRDVWRGSGDTRIIDMLAAKDYENSIPKVRWETILNEWFTENQMLRKETKRANIRDTDYLFLNYIYAHTLSYKKVESLEEYDLEHIIPIEKLKKIAQEGLPMSAISNLCFLPEKLNKEKKGLTIYEYYNNLVLESQINNDVARKELKEIEEYTWTSESELSFTDNLNQDNYKNFLQGRFRRLLELFYAKNKIN